MHSHHPRRIDVTNRDAQSSPTEMHSHHPKTYRRHEPRCTAINPGRGVPTSELRRTYVNRGVPTSTEAYLRQPRRTYVNRCVPTSTEAYLRQPRRTDVTRDVTLALRPPVRVQQHPLLSRNSFYYINNTIIIHRLVTTSGHVLLHACCALAFGAA
jgi:hypothetical protein